MRSVETMNVGDRLRAVVLAAQDPEFDDIQIIRTDGGENRLLLAIVNLRDAIANLPDPDAVEFWHDALTEISDLGPGTEWQAPGIAHQALAKLEETDDK
jgi:hypothetical protein